MSLAKRARERAGLTQVHLADLLGVSRSSVIRWENGGTVPGPVRAVLSLLEALPERTLEVLRASNGVRPQVISADDGHVRASDGGAAVAPAPTPAVGTATEAEPESRAEAAEAASSGPARPGSEPST